MEYSNIALATFFLSFLALTLCTLAQNSINDYVHVHNVARAQVGVGPISWNNTVARYARKYAKKRSDCELIHSNGPYGENIAWASYNLTGVDAVQMWIAEKPLYNYVENSCVGGECLHYTQVVWRDSIHLGCARVRCQDGGRFVTCNYDPPGNYEGERPY